MLKKTTSVLAAASVLALGGQAAPALAAATTWTVANPNADGSFTAESGPLTVKNSAGRTLFTCQSVDALGTMPSRSVTSDAGPGLGQFTWASANACTGGDGSAWNGQLGGSSAFHYFNATKFAAATGTTTFDQTHPSFFTFYTPGSNRCLFIIKAKGMTYTNATSTLKTTKAEVLVGNKQDGTPSCQGLLTQGETITFATEYEFTPAIKITATSCPV
ncbi:hypothetical protein [Actinocorallia populi]|uniref:hypothetical protein n=1 Tax=Actinocorallia populi TaxID=2079200 RepID=UPI000D08A431|nr:hypothetical protein [Actinocorallia populi]